MEHLKECWASLNLSSKYTAYAPSLSIILPVSDSQVKENHQNQQQSTVEFGCVLACLIKRIPTKVGENSLVHFQSDLSDDFWFPS